MGGDGSQQMGCCQEFISILFTSTQFISNDSAVELGLNPGSTLYKLRDPGELTLSF